MKNIILKYSYLFAITTVLFACNPDTFAPVVDVKMPDGEKALVPNMYLQTGIPISMYVGQTQAVLATNKNFKLDNATIELFEDGNLINGWLKGNIIDSPIYYIPNIKPKPGSVYTTKVSSMGFLTAEATDTMPSKLNFTVTKTSNLKYFQATDPFNGSLGFKDTLQEIKITWQDNGNASDFYRIVVMDNDSNGEYIYSAPWKQFTFKREIHSIDAIFQDSGDPIGAIGSGSSADVVRPNEKYFTDITFNGKQKEVSLYLPIGREENWQSQDLGFEKAYISLQHLSRAAYLHVTSVMQYNPNTGLFAQPTLVYSNYKNGFGILGCQSTNMQSVQVR